MIINNHEFGWLWTLLPVLYVTAPRDWIPGELVTSNMMNTLRDLFLEVEAGTAEMAKATLVGDTTSNLATIPSVAGQAAIAYDTTLSELVMSLNAGAFEPLGSGGFLPSNAIAIALGVV